MALKWAIPPVSGGIIFTGGDQPGFSSSFYGPADSPILNHQDPPGTFVGWYQSVVLPYPGDLTGNAVPLASGIMFTKVVRDSGARILDDNIRNPINKSTNNYVDTSFVVLDKYYPYCGLITLGEITTFSDITAEVLITNEKTEDKEGRVTSSQYFYTYDIIRNAKNPDNASVGGLKNTLNENFSYLYVGIQPIPAGISIPMGTYLPASESVSYSYLLGSGARFPLWGSEATIRLYVDKGTVNQKLLKLKTVELAGYRDNDIYP